MLITEEETTAIMDKDTARNMASKQHLTTRSTHLEVESMKDINKDLTKIEVEVAKMVDESEKVVVEVVEREAREADITTKTETTAVDTVDTVDKVATKKQVMTGNLLRT